MKAHTERKLTCLAAKALVSTALLVLSSVSCSSPPAPASPPSKSEGLIAIEAGRDALARGDSIRAEQYFARARLAGVASETLTPFLVRACLHGQRLRAALHYAEPHLEQHPEDQRLRVLVATLQLSLGQTAAATAHVRALLSFYPVPPDAHFLLAEIAEQRGQNIRPHLERYLALAPNGAHAAESRAQLLLLDSHGSQEIFLDVATNPSSGPKEKGEP